MYQQESLIRNTPLKALIVDDSTESCELMGKILQHYGCEYEICKDGIEAVETLQERVFNLLVLDWQMPYMNGGKTLEYIQRFCSNISAGNPLAVVMYSADEDIEPHLPAANNVKYLGICNKRNGYSTALRNFSYLLAKV